MSLPFKRLSGMKKVHDNSINITVDLWRRARDFFGALPCTFASLRSLTTSAKTVHRTVFFRRQVCSLLVRFPLFIFANAKSRPYDLLFVLAESKGFFRRTPVHLRVASLLDHVGENSPQDCFLPQTSLPPPCSNPKQKREAMPKHHFSFWRRVRDFSAYCRMPSRRFAP